MNCDDFYKALKGKLVRIFMKWMKGEYPYYAKVLNCYNVGNETLIMFTEEDCSEKDYFQIIKLSDVDEIYYFKSDEGNNNE